MSSPALRLLVGMQCALTLACSEVPGREAPEPLLDASEDASELDPRDAAADVETGDGAGAAPDASTDEDPTAPTSVTGVYFPPGPEFEQELQALLDFERTPMSEACPGLAQAGGCGNGVCESGESRDSCAADCIFHLIGAYNDLPICPAFQQRVVAHSVADVQKAVRDALQAGLRVRAVGARHSASGSICGDGLAIDMSELDDLEATRMGVEAGGSAREQSQTVIYVQPGVRMIDLGNYLAPRGLSIGFTHLGFRGVTVAGAIGTSAHGSSPRHNNSLSHRVVALTMVLADGSLRTFEEASTPSSLWRALTTHLGLLGVIVEVGLRVEPAFQLATEITLVDEQALLEGAGALGSLDGCDWGQFNWFPHHRQAFRWCGKVSQDPPEDVDNVLLDPGVSPDLAAIAKTGFHAGTCDSAVNASLEDARFDGLKNNPPLLRNLPDGTHSNTNQATGMAHRMTSADLIALGSNKYFQMDWEVAVPQQYIQDALRAARRVFDAHDVSLPGVGVFVRFGKIERGSWLSYHSAGKEFAEGQTAMFFETPVAVPAGYSESELRDYLHIYQGLIELFVRHFGARAHWGKNLDAIFELQSTTGTYEGRIEKMNQAVSELDPYGVFANAFARRIGVRWPRESEGFAALTESASEPCDLSSEPRCAYESHATYANACRAQQAGLASAALLPGICDALVWDTCSAFDSKTCVWDRKAREQSTSAPPLLSY